VPVDVLYVADYVSLVRNGLISNDQTVAEQPELVAAIVGATLRAWPTPSSIRAERSRSPRSTCRTSPKTRPAWRAGRAGRLARALARRAARRLAREDWQTTVDVLLQMGAIDQPVAVEALFTNRFAQPA
jgi:ABC-type nitrate/sulfonate/bicarbonate transport system substrate-binding protein